MPCPYGAGRTLTHRLLPATAALAAGSAAGANDTCQARGKARRTGSRDLTMQPVLLNNTTHRAHVAHAHAGDGHDGHVVRDALLT